MFTWNTFLRRQVDEVRDQLAAVTSERERAGSAAAASAAEVKTARADGQRLAAQLAAAEASLVEERTRGSRLDSAVAEQRSTQATATALQVGSFSRGLEILGIVGCCCQGWGVLIGFCATFCSSLGLWHGGHLAYRTCIR